MEPWIRWLVLALSCWIMFGNYYAFDNPSALNRHLHGWLGSEEEDFEYRLSLLYSVYSIPNIILPLGVGKWLDYFGNDWVLVVLSLLSTTGQGLFAFGVQKKKFWLALLGRFVFGVGGESLAVSQARIVTEWFHGRELGLAIGLNLSVARLDTITNNNLSPRIARMFGVPSALWFGLGTCVISLVSTIGCLVVERLSGKRSRVESMKPQVKAHGGGMSPVFVLLVVLCFLFYSGMIPYNNVASAYLQQRYYGEDDLKANLAMSLPDFLAIFLVPALGVFVDRTGRKVLVLVAGAAAFAFGHFLLAVGSSERAAVSSLVVLGFGYSTMLTFWACVPVLVPVSKHPLAYGALTASMNLSVSVVPIFVAALISEDSSYRTCGLFFSSLGVCALALTLVLSILNKKKKWRLDRKDRIHQVLPINPGLMSPDPESSLSASISFNKSS